MTGALESTDTNNYYPFRLNHISNSFSTSNFGSFYSYKYNGKELQETGMFDYGWRQYMPDLGRWNGIDQLAEAYTSTSTYAYVANNPVSQFDVDGRWMDDNGHIDTSGNANPFRDMAQSHMRMTQFMGRNPGEGGAGGQAQGHKPTIFKRIGNFLERLFGKSKKAAVGVLSVGVATFEGLAPPVEFGSTVAEIAGYARLGLWSLPLMLNGDSGFSANSKPITGAIDIPVTTTADESEPEFEYFYRAMSTKEYLSTGGFLQQKSDQSGNYRGEGPFVTDRLEYAERALNGFSKKDKYDLIVQYTMQPGTTNLLNSISLPHGPGVTGAYSEKLGLPIKKVELGGTNYGFYGSNVNIFNIRLMGPPIPIRYK
ncbi:RHS repeat-associated core domain-containing protein [Chryseobacterium sp. CBTAP 102]|uniref:RHS repeat-associated core domain-containing protein n=1 Tax=Chryseobacterium sp. CBTAP 102 TaxID=2135644 RepID=UPI000D773DC9|nr:RHS repeat-associated core domain-containing protein [Chryseobacterium sp. CBTAP 102]